MHRCCIYAFPPACTTGYEGTLVARYVARRFGFGTLRIALAGRSRSKLETVAELMLQETLNTQKGSEVYESGVRLQRQRHDALEKTPAGRDIVPFLVYPSWGHNANETEKYAAELVSSTTVVVALAGPFSQIGEPILKACAENGTDYVDITGECEWVKTMFDRYNTTAMRNRARLVPCCGFDYILNDVGVAAVHEALKPHKQLEVVQLCQDEGLRASRGTLRTIVDTLATVPLTALLPFSAEGVSWFPGYTPVEKSWIQPAVMTYTATCYIHWTNETQNYSYGRNFIYKNGKRTAGFLRAVWHSIFLALFFRIGLTVAHLSYPRGVLNALFKTSPVRRDEPLLRPGESVSVETAASAVKTNGTTVHVRHISRYDAADPYTMTTATVIAAALTCLKLRKENSDAAYGIGSPSRILGLDAVQTQLQLSGCSISMENRD